MICTDCAQEADGATYINPPASDCPVCRKVVAVNKTGKLRSHYAPGVGTGRSVRCKGSNLVLVGGHAACKGCDCKHKPKGSWRGQ